MLNVGIIGNGSIAGAHKAAYKRLQEQGLVQVAAFCDVRPDRLEGESMDVFTDARTYTDAAEMLKSETGKLDYVDICVPTYLHAEIAIAAMEAGFDVLSEKPMARTVEQAERMVEASMAAMAISAWRKVGTQMSTKSSLPASAFSISL